MVGHPWLRSRHVPGDAFFARRNRTSHADARYSGEILNKTLPTLKSGDTFVVPEGVFHLVGGITVAGLRNVTFQIDGTLMFTNDRKTWPRRSDTGRVLDCLQFVDIENVRFTSTTRGTLDGNGEPWWGAIKYLEHAEDRPKILQITNSAHLVVENILFKNSPYWTTFFDDVDGEDKTRCHRSHLALFCQETYGNKAAL